MRYRPRVSIRELVLLVAIVALMLGWGIDHRRQASRMGVLERYASEQADRAEYAEGMNVSLETQIEWATGTLQEIQRELDECRDRALEAERAVEADAGDG